MQRIKALLTISNILSITALICLLLGSLLSLSTALPPRDLVYWRYFHVLVDGFFSTIGLPLSLIATLIGIIAKIAMMRLPEMDRSWRFKLQIPAILLCLSIVTLVANTFFENYLKANLNYTEAISLISYDSIRIAVLLSLGIALIATSRRPIEKGQ